MFPINIYAFLLKGFLLIVEPDNELFYLTPKRLSDIAITNKNWRTMNKKKVSLMKSEVEFDVLTYSSYVLPLFLLLFKIIFLKLVFKV